MRRRSTKVLQEETPQILWKRSSTDIPLEEGLQAFYRQNCLTFCTKRTLTDLLQKASQIFYEKKNWCSFMRRSPNAFLWHKTFLTSCIISFCFSREYFSLFQEKNTWWSSIEWRSYNFKYKFFLSFFCLREDIRALKGSLFCLLGEEAPRIYFQEKNTCFSSIGRWSCNFNFLRQDIRAFKRRPYCFWEIHRSSTKKAPLIFCKKKSTKVLHGETLEIFWKKKPQEGKDSQVF